MKYFEFGQGNPELMVMLPGGGVCYRRAIPIAEEMAKVYHVLVCVYALNGARGFVQGFWQLLVILSVMNLMDRFLIDGYWVGHTSVWEIPGTEDLKPYITAKDKGRKWLFGTVGMAVIAAALAVIMTVFVH